MTRNAVSSSAIAAIGYDPATQRLEVEFKPDKAGLARVWEYDAIGPHVAEQLLSGASVGREFAIVRYNYTGRLVATITPDGVEHREEVASHE